jgi:putative transposase
VKRDSVGDFRLYFTADQEFRTVGARTGNSVGLDFGLKDFLVKSDGSRIVSPLFFKQARKEIGTKSRMPSSKKAGSDNCGKAGLDLARTPGR